MIPVTKPFLPPKEEYNAYIDQIWKRNWLTNNGPLVNELELRLKEYLDLNHILYLTNGTIAIQLAIKALNLKGEIITTPFSYVATTSSLVWEGCTPVFVDIDSETFNINPALIEEKITRDTSAILATHVYGNPCDIDAIEKIGKKHNLKIIFDAAHGFGSKYNGSSVFSYGDISTTSFHATKLFHTVEGGAVFSPNPELIYILSRMRNFGHNGPEEFYGVGINGKNSEFHAAMGLCNLNHIEAIIHRRKECSHYYDEKLKLLNVKKPLITKGAEFNYAYYAVLFDTEEALIKAIKNLEDNRISPRRYFYPLLSKLDYVESCKLPVAERIAKKVLCLPLYFDLSFEEIDMIARILLRAQNY